MNRLLAILFLSTLPGFGAGITTNSMRNYPQAFYRPTNYLLGVTDTGTGFVTKLFFVGYANTNLSSNAVVFGATNRVESRGSVIAGGENNAIYGSADTNSFATIGGGEYNRMAGNIKHAIIATGLRNWNTNGRYSGSFSAWDSGIGPSINASNCFIGGGYSNFVNAWNSTIAGGYFNFIREGPANDFVANFIGGGGFHNLTGSYSVIAGGSQNTIATNGTLGVIGGEGCFIGAGRGNVAWGNRNFIGSGLNNRTTNDAAYGFIGSGVANYIDTSAYSAIVDGLGNGIDVNADNSFIGGGNLNRIGQFAAYCSITGGQNNKIEDFNIGSSIAGNNITNATQYSHEFGGSVNGTKSRGDDEGFAMLGSMTVAVTNKTTTYTATTRDHVILCSASGGAYAVTLPAASARKGLMLHIKKTDATGNAVTVTRAGSDTIQGSTTVSLASQYSAVTIYSDGSATWYKYAANQ